MLRGSISRAVSTFLINGISPGNISIIQQPMLTTKNIVLVFLAFIAGFIVMVTLSIIYRQPRAFFDDLARYQAKRNSAEAIRKAERMLAEDIYGGTTPEETFAMFLDALRAGDTDLASKYFVLQKQEEWRENLGKVKETELLPIMIDDLSKATF